MALLGFVCFIIFLLNKLDFSIKPQPPPYDVRWRHPRCFECIYFKKCKGVNPPRRVSMSIKADSEFELLLKED